jgi:hypothetical protein
MSEQMEEFKTNNKVHSRSLYLQFQGAKVANK